MSDDHGTRAAYDRGCRCDGCRAANAQAAREARATRRGRTPPQTVKHGLSAARNWGCKCEVCREALRVANAATYVRLARAKGVTPRAPQHSTHRTCSSCKVELPIENFPRNGRSRRRVCGPCYRAQQRKTDAAYRRANGERRRAAEARRARRLRAEDAAWRERRNQEARNYSHAQAVATEPFAVNHRKEWTGPELEVIARDDLTAIKAARMLGRTAAAVKAQRRLLNVDPRKINLAGVSR